MKITHAELPSGNVAVYLDNRRAGTIIKVNLGFAYVPSHHRASDHGEVFPTIAEVLASLE